MSATVMPSENQWRFPQSNHRDASHHVQSAVLFSIIGIWEAGSFLTASRYIDHAVQEVSRSETALPTLIGHTAVAHTNFHHFTAHNRQK